MAICRLSSYCYWFFEFSPMASTYLEKDMDAEMKELEENDDMDDSDNDSGNH